MDWNSNKAKDYFISLSQSKNPDKFHYKPRIQLYFDLHDIELAYKDLYVQCAKASQTKVSLLTFLAEADTKRNFISSPPYDIDKYKETYLIEVKRLWNDILLAKLTF